MFVVIFVFFQETSQNIKKRKQKCEILQEITFHRMTIEFLKLSVHPELQVIFFL